MSTHTPSQKHALEFLHTQKIAVLSTVDKHSVPHGAAIYFVVDNDFRFYFLTTTGTAKYANIAANPNVSLVIADDYQQTTVQVMGIAEEVPTGDEHDNAFRMIAQVHPPGQFAWVPPVSKMHTGEVKLMRVTPSECKLSVFRPEPGEGGISIENVPTS